MFQTSKLMEARFIAQHFGGCSVSSGGGCVSSVFGKKVLEISNRFSWLVILFSGDFEKLTDGVFLLGL